jgi:uncharacterized protein
MASISSNGVALLNPKARAFCQKWKDILSLGISIDGCPELHGLNRRCLAGNEDGTRKGSWQYIEEIWPWYKEHFPSSSLRTKWTLAPNSYKYFHESVRFLHETLGMRYLHFNRVMEDDVLDSPEQLWELIQQFEKVVDYAVEHHLDLSCEPFGYGFTMGKTKAEQLREDPSWSRCGFGKMPAVALDGKIYPCFRMLPGNNKLKKPSVYAQGSTDTSFLENQDVLEELNINSSAVRMNVQDKCESCRIFTLCPHCAADCVDEGKPTLTKTTSVCSYTRLQTYFARKYWEVLKQKHPSIYFNNPITWKKEETDELLNLVLKEIVRMKEERDGNNS